MKICILTGIFYPEVGGPATFLYNLADKLVRCGHQLVIITYADELNKYKYSYPVIKVSRKLPIGLRNLKMIYQIIRIGKYYDLLFVNGINIEAYIANKLIKKPMIIKVVGDLAWEIARRKNWLRDGIELFQEKKYSKKIEFIRKIDRLCIKSADLVITPSNYLKKIILKWGVSNEKIKVIYNGIKISDYEVQLKKSEAKKKLLLSEKIKILLSIGRFTQWKGMEDLIKVMKLLNNNIKLILIGGGPMEEELKLLSLEFGVEDKIIFPGWVSREKIPLYLRAADVFILNSKYEGLSHVILEAMAVGVPIIATNIGGNPELLTHQINGLLIPANDNILQLKEAIEKLLYNEELTQKFIQKNKEIIKKFSWDNIFLEFLRTFLNFSSFKI